MLECGLISSLELKLCADVLSILIVLIFNSINVTRHEKIGLMCT